jgi:predicted metal-binding membrane protein
MAIPKTAPPPLPTRERVIVWGGLAAITALAWIAMVRIPMPAAAMGSAAMPAMRMAATAAGSHQWSLTDAWLVFAMWAVMMVAMMIPSATPMIEMYARIARGNAESRAWFTWAFVGGYAAAWTLFSIGATAAQWALARAAIMAEAMRVGPIAGAAILAVAGIYQLTPLKNACLAHCRSPVGFFMTEWRGGAGGALMMGLKHGAFCIGCCWMLMALLFVAGVMNLLWIAALAAIVLIEKVTPWGAAVARVSGVAMIASAAALLALC